jgi:hypothetical protein
LAFAVQGNTIAFRQDGREMMVVVAKGTFMLVVSSSDRPCRWPDLEKEVFGDIAHKLGRGLASGSVLFRMGRSGIALALEHAAALFDSREHQLCVVAGVESLLRRSIADHYQLKEPRLLTSATSSGLTLGEAGAAVLIALPAWHRRFASEGAAQTV